MNVLETICAEILKHDKENPDHGVGCACMDKHAFALRKMLCDNGMGITVPYSPKSRMNLATVLSYIVRDL